jgi:hypothetical protein
MYLFVHFLLHTCLHICRSEKEFARDVRRVFYNASIYNPERDPVYMMAGQYICICIYIHTDTYNASIYNPERDPVYMMAGQYIHTQIIQFLEQYF